MSERSEQDLLDELAERCGIAPDYYDNWGRRHVASSETKRAILSAMGIAAGTTDGVRRELLLCEEAPWRRPCDPVLVRRAGGDLGAWSFRVPVEEAEDRAIQIRWEVRDEAGRVCQKGEAGPGLASAEIRWLDGRRHARFEVPVPTGLDIGYYDLAARTQTASAEHEGTLRLILAPARCYVPAQFEEGRRIWGLALQLYALRSTRNWGVGDFGDLANVVEWAAKDLGAGVIGLNPLHALKNSRPYHISPYSPDSRLFLNVLYIAVEQIPEFAESAAAQRLLEDSVMRSKLETLRKGEFVDYDGAYAAKIAVLETLFATFVEQHLAGDQEPGGIHRTPITERGRAFERYVREEGEILERFALFQALSEELRQAHPQVWAWQDWPEPYRNPRSDAVAAFRSTHRTRIRFYQYLQWVADGQLRAIAERARALGMPLGLYHDLALGSDWSGSDAWAFQDVLALGADSGCPPDAFAPDGQNWGLPPMNPRQLRDGGYRMLIAMLRNNLTRGGALRLDHVMGLSRLFWIPRGLPASAGAYVHYPAEDLLSIVALESVRHQSVIVGEDLGTVPDWIRERLADRRVWSYRVFYFERDGNGVWKDPRAYPEHAVAVVTTHDLPTLAGFWSMRDIETRTGLGFYQEEASRRLAFEERQRDKVCLVRALKDQGLVQPEMMDGAGAASRMTPDLCRAVHAYLARTPSWVVMATLEDMVGEMDQTNVPGTLDSHPNWSRKVRFSLNELREDPAVKDLAAQLRSLRPPKP
jgi:4-alpha-glucanotransferase